MATPIPKNRARFTVTFPQPPPRTRAQRQETRNDRPCPCPPVGCRLIGFVRARVTRAALRRFYAELRRLEPLAPVPGAPPTFPRYSSCCALSCVAPWRVPLRPAPLRNEGSDHHVGIRFRAVVGVGTHPGARESRRRNGSFRWRGFLIAAHHRRSPQHRRRARRHRRAQHAYAASARQGVER